MKLVIKQLASFTRFTKNSKSNVVFEPSFLSVRSGLTCFEEHFCAVIMLPGAGHMEWGPKVAVMGFHESPFIDHELNAVSVPCQTGQQLSSWVTMSCISLAVFLAFLDIMEAREVWWLLCLTP